jgi:hypothetical protein
MTGRRAPISKRFAAHPDSSQKQEKKRIQLAYGPHLESLPLVLDGDAILGVLRIEPDLTFCPTALRVAIVAQSMPTKPTENLPS